MKRLRGFSVVFVVAIVLFSAFVGIAVTYGPDLTIQTASPTDPMIQDANSLIEANQILVENRNLSTLVAIGEVKKVESLIVDSETRTIMTDAEIRIDVSLTGNLHANDSVTVRYVGGTVGNMTLWVRTNWAYGPEDTVQLPDDFKLSIGTTILFFAAKEDDYFKLLTYLPFSKDKANLQKDYGVTEEDMFLLSESQPSTTVNEVSGYGFEWIGIHRNWNNLPINYYIDTDGTADITGTSEFNAINSAFTTWEDLRFSGIDFTYMGSDINVTTYQKDDKNILLWITRSGSTWVSMTYGWPVSPSDPLHTIETDIEFNDRYTFSIGAQANCYDVQSIATHEIGHWLTLEDLDSAAQTMYKNAFLNDISMRSLKWGDENGAHYIYPVHNDANSGGDGSNTFSGATGGLLKATPYYGRLCDLPTPDHALDTQDFYKIYASSTDRLSFHLSPPSNADFDLELYNPSGSLVAYSRNRGNGVYETILRDGGMGTAGWWRMRIVRYSTGGQGGNGQYSFQYRNMPVL